MFLGTPLYLFAALKMVRGQSHSSIIKGHTIRTACLDILSNRCGNEWVLLISSGNSLSAVSLQPSENLYVPDITQLVTGTESAVHSVSSIRYETWCTVVCRTCACDSVLSVEPDLWLLPDRVAPLNVEISQQLQSNWLPAQTHNRKQVSA